MAKKKIDDQAKDCGLSGGSFKEIANNIKLSVNSKKGRNLVQTYDEDDDLTVKRISTGVPKLDRILGKGSNGWGWPRGQVSLINGPQSSGKTSLILSSIAQAQKEGVCVLIDGECSYSPDRAIQFGIDVESLLVVNPDYAEEALDACVSLSETGQIRMICVDSMDSLQAKTIVDSSFEDNTMGLMARMNNRFLPQAVKLAKKHDVTFLLVAQVRNSIGGYGSSEVISGGKGMGHYPQTILDIRKLEDIKPKDGSPPTGQFCKVKTKKNKSAAPQQQTTIRLDYDSGFNVYSDVLDLCIDEKIVAKGGSWFTYGELKIQGEDNFVKELQSNKELYEDLLRKIGML